MRHAKHRFQLGVKKEHRKALITNLAASLIEHGRITTTLAKAKALRPFIEKVITMAKKAAATEDKVVKLHYRRLAYSRMRNLKDAVNLLFDQKATDFLKREGGYTRIYKVLPRIGDAADMALIEFVAADDQGYKKQKKSRGKGRKNKATDSTAPAVENSETKSDTALSETSVAVATDVAVAETVENK